MIQSPEEIDKIWNRVVLTRRNVLSNVSKIFDPTGFVPPVTLLSKILLRESWCGNQGWDDPLSKEQCLSWLNFLRDLLNLDQLRIPRSIWPQGEIVGLPILMVFTDGPISAFGVAAYARWELRGGFGRQ